jgi:predicted MFS family arabinose efflux permease
MIHVYTQVIPALIPVLKKDLGITLVQASYLLSIPLLVNVIAYLPAGIISDRYGSKIMLVCFLITGIGASIIALSNNFLVLGVGAVLLGLGSTLYHPPSLKTASLVEPSKMNLAMSFHLMGGTSGIALGPITLGILMPLIGWRKAMLIWVPFQAVLAYFSLIFTKQNSERVETEKLNILEGIRNIMRPDYLLVIISGSFFELTVVNISGFTTTYFTTHLGLSESLSSIIFGLGPLAGIVGAFASGRIGDRLGNFNTLIVITSSIIILLAVIPTTKLIFFASSIYIIYRGLVSAFMPLLNNLIAINSDVENRSLAFAFYFMLSNIGASAMPYITSLLAQDRGISILFPLSVLLLIPTLIIILFMRHKDIH